MEHLTTSDHGYYTLASPSASSSEYPDNKYCYDIFINHRGREVKNGLASHLYHRLCDNKLRVFLDKREMEVGDHITPQLKGAIESSSVHIAIFSENYTESKWCLNELLWMLKSKGTVIPIFYHVKPGDVPWAGKDTAFGKGLYSHIEKTTEDPFTGEVKPRYPLNTIKETIEKWRKALTSAADLSGLSLDEDCNGDEGELVKEIVRRVQKKVIKTPLPVATYAKGLREKVYDLEKNILLDQQSGPAQIAGIVGLGGMGKTTLAKEIFNRRSTSYNASCFLSNVREAAGKGALPSLQTELLSTLYPANISLQINSILEGKGILRKFLKSCHGLLVLDDVDDAQQLDALLLPVKDVLFPGSLILVTSRSKEVLTRWGILESSIYRLSGLDRSQSEELFCWHAFHQPDPVEEFEKLVPMFLDKCDGLPLSLEVIGTVLHNKNLEYWKYLFNKIKISSDKLPDEIQKIQKTLGLEIIYDILDEAEKDIFLDIACFFIGGNKDKAIRIWDGSGWQGSEGLRKLEEKCLIEVDDKNCIRMHDLFIDLGRNLAERVPRRRLYRPTANLFHNVPHQSSVRGISMVPENAADFRNCSLDMTELQLLRGHGDCLGSITSLPIQSDPIWLRWICCPLGLLGPVKAEGDCLESISNLLRQSNLLWLYWDEYPYTSLPPWIPIKNLRVLELKGCSQLETLWPEHENEAPLELRELNIDAELLQLPKSIGQLILLEKIEIKELIQSLPEEFFHLSSLKHLRLSTRMSRLPNSFSRLTSLQHVDLSGSAHLKTLPPSFGSLRNLRHIDLSRCTYLETLPSSFGKLTNLQHINLNECFSLQTLPHSFGSLLRLKHLSLAGCHQLTFSTETLGNITTLESLDLSRCGKIEVLPPQVTHQRCLEELNLSGTILQELFKDIGKLTNLEILKLDDCPFLKILPASLGHLTNLKELTLSRCKNLKRLPDSVGEFKQLTTLMISGAMIGYLPVGVKELHNLEFLSVTCCPLLQVPFASVEVEKIEGEREPSPHSTGRGLLESSIDKCSCIDKCICMRRLKRLDLHGTAIKEFSFPQDVCPNLQLLDVSDCVALAKVGALPQKLRSLNLTGCTALKEITGLCGLQNLHIIS